MLLCFSLMFTYYPKLKFNYRNPQRASTSLGRPTPPPAAVTSKGNAEMHGTSEGSTETGDLESSLLQYCDRRGAVRTYRTINNKNKLI